MNDRHQAAAVALLGAIAGAAFTAAVLVDGREGFALAALALAVAVGATVDLPVPFGGRVPMAYALLAALAELQPAQEFVLVTAAGTLLAVLAVATRRGVQPGTVLAVRVLASAGAGLAAVALLDTVAFGEDMGLLGRTLTIGAAVLGTDAAVARLQHLERGPHLRSAAPVYLTLLCGGALIAVAHDASGPWMATVALFPLLITRFSFRRQVEAQETFGQTVQALGIVPELAGLAPLGHSERTAVYADRLAVHLGFSPHERDRIVLAARLHHLGAVSVDAAEPAPGQWLDPAELAEHGANILREGGFPSDVATLVADAEAGSLDRAAPSLEAAVVRIAVAFDDIVGEDATLADRALAIIAGRPRDAHSRRAVAGLLALVAAEADVAREAIDSGARFTEVAAGLDLEALVVPAPSGELLAFSRRRT